MSLVANEAPLRRKACALALPALPLTFLVAALVVPTDSTENATQLAAAAAHGARWQAAALLELLAAALLPLAVAGLVAAVRRRGVVLANVAAALGCLGTIGLASIGLRHLFVYGLTAADPHAALRVLDRLDGGAGALALPCMFAAPLSLIVASGALVRAGLARRWVVAGAVVYLVVDMLPIPGAELVQALVGLVTFGTVAAGLLRVLDAEPSATAVRRAPAGAAAAEA